jgi:hypothetical protein
MSGSIIMPATPSIIRTRRAQWISNLSGGDVLVSGIVRSMTLRSLSGVVYVGGTGAEDMPYLVSSQGILVAGGESITLDVGNFNQVRVVAATSGYSVSYIGVA